MADEKEAKELLEQLLAELYAKQAGAQAGGSGDDSYLQAADGQYLGRITDNPYDTQSITNSYGPFGSPYSQTSIFNAYSKYGSEYGQLSLNNPYCQQPPRLFIRGSLMGPVSKNPYVPDRIPTEAFLYSLKNDLRSLLAGRRPAGELAVRANTGDTFILAGDGKFLGSLNPNRYKQDSLFNKYGPYGNRYSQTSIFNKYSPYGSRLSSLSAYNPRATNPPKVLSGDKEIAWLTSNRSLNPRLDPDEILDWAARNVRRKY